MSGPGDSASASESVPRSHRDLRVWQLAMALTETVYKLSLGWPKHELYGLVSQARRASVSVAANLAEGAGRRTSGEFQQFTGVARGSLAELETLLILSVRLGYTAPQTADHILSDVNEVGRMLSGLMSSLDRKPVR